MKTKMSITDNVKEKTPSLMIDMLFLDHSSTEQEAWWPAHHIRRQERQRGAQVSQHHT